MVDWEYDQTVTAIANTHKSAFCRNLIIATKLATEWSPIISEMHRIEYLATLSTAMKSFVEVPEPSFLPSSICFGHSYAAGITHYNW